MNEENSFIHLRKLCSFCAMSTKPVRKLQMLGNEVESSQNASYYIQNSFLLWCFRE